MLLSMKQWYLLKVDFRLNSTCRWNRLRGIKVWECADSWNGFVCDLNVYTGKQRDGNPEQGLGYRVVHNLTRTLVGKNHHVFVDNFFNSVNLAEDLLQDKIYICGTVRSNRQGIPRELRLQQNEWNNFAKESPCFFVKEIWSLLFGRTRNQFISWALSQIQWAMKRSVEGNEMERWLKCRVRRLWNLTTTTWAAWIWVINFGATTWPAESPKNGGDVFYGFWWMFR